MVRHYEKGTKKPLLTRFPPENVLFRLARALNGASSNPNLNRGCLPALCGTGRAGCAGYRWTPRGLG